MICKECHHLPSYRCGSTPDGYCVECYCKCHDKADNNNAALRQSLEDFSKYLQAQLEEWEDQKELLIEFFAKDAEINNAEGQIEAIKRIQQRFSEIQKPCG